ncbi:tripartite tricarboxylate transporter TctB family protein [Desulforhopalus singaporensis]|uniref:Tripartite tricarboxylate transporter TctB family protein n=1 Tax=Desulforhopalus singaporensis TaxID=91360 RepID=A0A1H0VMS6_9BACT|nr:tripartite tricarboxylate transporter TctB family protein [Desulforhopalus singaporensis]SDP79899.1 Tripartite tricarboxylate transporter TctB family protein [Desulforhopalus singaporensis]
MRKGEYIIATILGLLGLFIFIHADQIPTMVAVEKSSVVNSRFFPKLMSVLLVIFSIILFVQNSLLHKKTKIMPQSNNEGKNSENKSYTSWMRMSAAVGMCILFLIFYESGGFLVTSILFMFSFLLIVGVRNWISLILISILPPVIVYFIFKVLLSVPLPEGVLSL